MPAAYAVVPRHAPGPGKGGGTFSPVHVTATRHDILDAGDPFNTRHIIHDGDFYMEGKPFIDPGVHVNFYSNEASTNSIAQKFFGGVAKLRYLRQPSRIVRGRQTPRGADVIITPPAPATYGDFASYTAGTIRGV